MPQFYPQIQGYPNFVLVYHFHRKFYDLIPLLAYCCWKKQTKLRKTQKYHVLLASKLLHEYSSLPKTLFRLQLCILSLESLFNIWLMYLVSKIPQAPLRNVRNLLLTSDTYTDKDTAGYKSAEAYLQVALFDRKLLSQHLISVFCKQRHWFLSLLKFLKF